MLHTDFKFGDGQRAALVAFAHPPTDARFDSQFQLRFVDIGLMPLVESEIGQRLEDLIIRNVSLLKAHLGWETVSDAQGEWLLQTAAGNRAGPLFETPPHGLREVYEERRLHRCKGGDGMSGSPYGKYVSIL